MQPRYHSQRDSRRVCSCCLALGGSRVRANTSEVPGARRRSEGLVKVLGVAGAVALLIRIFGKFESRITAREWYSARRRLRPLRSDKASDIKVARDLSSGIAEEEKVPRCEKRLAQRVFTQHLWRAAPRRHMVAEESMDKNRKRSSCGCRGLAKKKEEVFLPVD